MHCEKNINYLSEEAAEEAATFQNQFTDQYSFYFSSYQLRSSFSLQCVKKVFSLSRKMYGRVHKKRRAVIFASIYIYSISYKKLSEQVNSKRAHSVNLIVLDLVTKKERDHKKHSIERTVNVTL